MNAMKRHTLAILAAVLAACIIIVGMTCPAALAAEQLLRANGKHYNYFLDGKTVCDRGERGIEIGQILLLPANRKHDRL